MLKWNNPVQSHFCSIFKQCAESEESCRRSSECCDTKDVCVRDRQQGTCNPNPPIQSDSLMTIFMLKDFFKIMNAALIFLSCVCVEKVESAGI